MRRDHAFTLVETLVVVGIVGVLAALLFPVLARSKRAAGGSACLQTERQLGVALLLYAEDESGRLPPTLGGVHPRRKDPPLDTPTFYDLVERYRGGPLLCRDRERLDGIPASMSSGYALNGQPETAELLADRGHRTIGWKAADAAYPARTLLLLEARAGLLRLWFLDEDAPRIWGGCSLAGVFDRAKSSPEGARRHGSRGNYVFVDGHAKSYSAEQMSRADPEGPTFSLDPRE